MSSEKRIAALMVQSLEVSADATNALTQLRADLVADPDMSDDDRTASLADIDRLLGLLADADGNAQDALNKIGDDVIAALDAVPPATDTDWSAAAQDERRQERAKSAKSFWGGR